MPLELLADCLKPGRALAVWYVWNWHLQVLIGGTWQVCFKRVANLAFGNNVQACDSGPCVRDGRQAFLPSFVKSRIPLANPPHRLLEHVFTTTFRVEPQEEGYILCGCFAVTVVLDSRVPL